MRERERERERERKRESEKARREREESRREGLLDKQRPVLVGLRMEYGNPACGGNPIHKGVDTRGERERGRHEEEEEKGARERV